ARQDRLALLPVERVLHREGARLTPVDVAEQSGLPLDLLRRLWRALGLTDAGDTEVAFTESDLAAAKTVALFRAAGLGEEPLVLISQVVGQSMSRLSETLREIAGQALLQALDSVALADQQSELMPQLRAGIASGQAIPQSGDWYGAPVNLASRVTDLARPGSVLATKPVRDAAEDSFAWSYAGARHLKGVKG